MPPKKNDDKDEGTRVCPACGKDHGPDKDPPLSEKEQAAHHQD